MNIHQRSIRRSIVRGFGIAAVAATLAAATAFTPAANPASDLRTTLNTLMQEHVYLAAAATASALGGRDGDFKAAAGALDANSVALSKAIGSVYGADAGTAFLALWRKHIGFVVDYALGVATNDKGKQDKAVNALVGYTRDFGAFLASANPNLTTDAVAGLVKEHILTLKKVIDAQAAKDPSRAYMEARAAAAHMSMIANPLADAIIKQFPSRFASK